MARVGDLRTLRGIQWGSGASRAPGAAGTLGHGTRDMGAAPASIFLTRFEFCRRLQLRIMRLCWGPTLILCIPVASICHFALLPT